MVVQPTGGVIVVTDKTPSEPKALMELKARKSKPAPAAENMDDRVNEALRSFRFANQMSPSELARAGAGAGGAAEAAGVLTAIDEDGEGGEEAECPREFEYDTDVGDE